MKVEYDCYEVDVILFVVLTVSCDFVASMLWNMDHIHIHCKRSTKKKISKKNILYSTLINKNFKEFT